MAVVALDDPLRPLQKGPALRRRTRARSLREPFPPKHLRASPFVAHVHLHVQARLLIVMPARPTAAVNECRVPTKYGCASWTPTAGAKRALVLLARVALASYSWTPFASFTSLRLRGEREPTRSSQTLGCGAGHADVGPPKTCSCGGFLRTLLRHHGQRTRPFCSSTRGGKFRRVARLYMKRTLMANRR